MNFQVDDKVNFNVENADISLRRSLNENTGKRLFNEVENMNCFVCGKDIGEGACSRCFGKNKMKKKGVKSLRDRGYGF